MLFQLAALAIIVAIIPITLVIRSRDTNKYRKLIWVTAFITFDLIAFGAFTRLSDSGLGCPDWPGCYGKATPAQAMPQIIAEQTAMPTGPVTVPKAWIEMIHRYVAMVVGFLIIVIVAMAWRRRNEAQQSPWPATLILVLVCVQGAFGAWTVTLKLQPIIVSIHLMLGNLLLLSLVWLASTAHAKHHYSNSLGGLFAERANGLRWAVVFGLFLLFTQIGLGGWVSTNYAALACPDFPLCHGKLMPDDMNFKAGYELWRPLGKTASGEGLPFKALVAIHWTHRMFALVVLAYLVYLAWRLRQVTVTRKVAGWLVIAAFAQVITGMTTVFFQWPLAIALIHSAGAAVLVFLLTRSWGLLGRV
jgi:heme a synthase